MPKEFSDDVIQYNRKEIPAYIAKIVARIYPGPFNESPTLLAIHGVAIDTLNRLTIEDVKELYNDKSIKTNLADGSIIFEWLMIASLAIVCSSVGMIAIIAIKKFDSQDHDVLAAKRTILNYCRGIKVECL